MNPLLIALLKNVIIPEIMEFIDKKFNQTGKLPTEEELKQLIDDKAGAIVMKGEALIAEIQRA